MKSKKHNDIFEMILNASNGRDTQAAIVSDRAHSWEMHQQEGQLAVDVVATKDEIILLAPMAGVDTGNIEVYVHNDLLTIRGVRVYPGTALAVEHAFHEECYWGPFSRSIVLPMKVKGDLAVADYSNGILTVRIPKQMVDARIPVTIIDE